MEKLKKGFVFGSINFDGRIEVIRIHKKKNKIIVRLTQLMVIEEFCEWNETWSLEDTIWKFKSEELFEKEFPGYPKTKKQELDDYVEAEKEKIDKQLKADNKPWWKFW